MPLIANNNTKEKDFPCSLVGVVLAGGRSRRLGHDKRIVRLDDKSMTLLEHVIEVLRQCVEKIAVSHRAEEKPVCQDASLYHFISDVVPQGQHLGPFGAVYSCLRTLKAPILVVPCDLPFLTTETLQNLIRQRDCARKHALRYDVPLPLMTTYRQEKTGFIEGLMAIYEYEALPFFENALSLGIYKLNSVIDPARRVDIVYSEKEAKPFFNLNYPDDLRRARTLIHMHRPFSAEPAPHTAATGSFLEDALGRSIRYVRLSVTDRCNLRCFYCSNEAKNFIPHTAVLRYEEMERLVGVLRHMGVGKVRITGGEPFVRKGLVPFLERLHEKDPQLDLRVTTNGTLVKPYITALAECKLNAVNLSLDTLQPATFMKLTQHDGLSKVLDNLEAMLAVGLRVKLNAVALRGVNDGQLKDFLAIAQQYKIDVRFIEFMPMGEDTQWNQSFFWSAEEIVQAAQTLTNLRPSRLAEDNLGPARMYDLDGGGRLGVISAVSNHFCGTCNRLRITASGQLRTCLFDDREYSLRQALRHPHIQDQTLMRIIQRALQNKPLGVHLLEAREQHVARQRMMSIGG